MIKARVRTDFHYYREMQDRKQSTHIWTHADVLCSVSLISCSDLVIFIHAWNI